MLKRLFDWLPDQDRPILNVDDAGVETIRNSQFGSSDVESMRILYHRIRVRGTGLIFRKPARTFYRCEVVVYPTMKSYRYQIATADREEMIKEAITRVGESLSAHKLMNNLLRAA